MACKLYVVCYACVFMFSYVGIIPINKQQHSDVFITEVEALHPVLWDERQKSPGNIIVFKGYRKSRKALSCERNVVGNQSPLKLLLG